MTRITNFGKKRTYVEAGFSNAEDGALAAVNTHTDAPTTSHTTPDQPTVPDSETVQPPPKKKRKRTPKSKRDGYGTLKKAEGGEEGESSKGNSQLEPDSHTSAEKPSAKSKKSSKKKKEFPKKSKHITDSEARRLKRISERDAVTTCFACREKGHAARNCPKTSGGSGGSESKGTKQVVGICYRCGSTRHTLSRCRKAIDPLDPLPFASCFVCSGKGHLASACPQNKDKGVYPNGGCCKLCGDKSHLAKDCGLNKDDLRQGVLVLGSAANGEVGADEDDFHIFKRRKEVVEREEKKDSTTRKSAIEQAALSERQLTTSTKTMNKGDQKKVVYF